MRRNIVRVLGLAVLFAAWPLSVSAQLTVEIQNAYNLVVDSNVTAPSTYSPSAGYIGARVCNIGGADLADVTAFIGDYKGGVGDTPGRFPRYDSTGDTSRPQVLNTGSYALDLEAGATGTADGTRYMGTLRSGECRMQYWLFSYPRCVNVNGQPQQPPCTTSIAGGVKPDDDVRLDYDVWVGAPSTITAVQSRSFTLRNEISASANKIWPNTTSKVPSEYLAAIESVLGWGTLGPDGQPLDTSNTVYPGQRVITTQGIWYDLGNVGHGFDNDGDLVPDQNAWMQPVGDAAAFDGGCFRLVKTYGLVIVKLKTGGELLIPFQDQLYFERLPDNTGVVGLVYYQYVATGGGCQGNLTPYQEAASGFDNEKFNGDYGYGIGFESRDYGTDLTFEKTKASPAGTPAQGDTLTYRLHIPTNDTGVPLGAPDLSAPLVFREQIPGGTTFVGGSITTTPPATTTGFADAYTQRFTAISASGASTTYDCTIRYNITSSVFRTLYSVDGGATWTLTQPATPANVTDLQWVLLASMDLDGGWDGRACLPNDGITDSRLQASLPPGKSASVTFQVTIGGTAPIVCNTATLAFGSATEGTASNTLCVPVAGNNTLGGTVFRDYVGNAATDYDGTRNGAEVGIGAGVRVDLYYDANADGTYDSGDVLVSTTSTAANGSYQFTSVADGRFVVVAKKWDGATSDGINNAVHDFWAGHANTTRDPNLALATDSGVLRLDEAATLVSLAVTVDLDHSNAADESLATPTLRTIDFGFAPPFQLTKVVTGNPDANGDRVADALIGETRTFSYTITLQNRLPGASQQTAAGCQYTYWATTGDTGVGVSGGKVFTNPGGAWDRLNRNEAFATVEGGGKSVIRGWGFPVVEQAGAGIVKVEALYYGYFNLPLTDDYLDLAVSSGGSSSALVRIPTAEINTYVGQPAVLDGQSAFAWDVTGLRPGVSPSAWSWADLLATVNPVSFLVNPGKTANTDAKTYYLDGIGLRITTDAACATNASTTLSPVPLRDTYDTSRMSFVSANPTPSGVNTATGVLTWNDVGPIEAGATRAVTVTMRAAAGNLTGSCPALSAYPAGGPPPSPANSGCNWAEGGWSGSNVKYADGRTANDAFDNRAVSITVRSKISGTVWWNSTVNTSIDAGEARFPGVPMTLFACVLTDGSLLTVPGNNRTCSGQGGTWSPWVRTVTDSNGFYEFGGLDAGFYVVELQDADSQAGPGSPVYGMTLNAQRSDDQNPAPGSMTTCPAAGCDNTWGDPTLRLDNNFLLFTVPTTQTNVDFGYDRAGSVLTGTVWNDLYDLADGSRERGEPGLAGWTVSLTNGSVTFTTTTDANGNYGFSGLTNSTWTITVTRPSLPSQAWKETWERVGGTTNLNDSFAVSVDGTRRIYALNDFSYRLGSTTTIGDTVFIDRNGNAAWDGPTVDTAIPNVSVLLYRDVNRNGVIDPGSDPLVATTTTDAGGRYLFTDVAAGSYLVEVDQTDADFPADVLPLVDPETTTARISGRMYLGVNAADAGIPNALVLLYGDTNGDGSVNPASDSVVAALRSGLDGSYAFTGLTAGRYLVQVASGSLPANLTQTNAFSTVTLGSNMANATADGAYTSATGYALGNRVWYDANNNGSMDDGEAGIAGVTVTLTPGAGGACAYSCTTITDAGGYWIIPGLTGSAGGISYTVAFSTLPASHQAIASFTQTINTSSVMTADRRSWYTGSAATSPVGSLSGGSVFLDADGDRLMDAGEAMGGVEVALIDAAGVAVALTSTDASGGYAFTGVRPGAYLVRVLDDTVAAGGDYTAGIRYANATVTAAITTSAPDVVFDLAEESIADGRSAVTVDGVRSDLMQDFGFYRFAAPGSIGDTVFLDANRNGTEDIGEPGIVGASLSLLDCVWSAGAGGTDTNGNGIYDDGEGTCSTVQTTTTDSTGTYLFTGLSPLASGHFYVVRVTAMPPGSWALSSDPETDGAVDGAGISVCLTGTAPSYCDGATRLKAFIEGQTYLSADFGYYGTSPSYGFFGDRVWLDQDGDGIQSASERGIPNVRVYVDLDSSGSLTTGDLLALTDGDGYYVMPVPGNGPYTVRLVATDLPAGVVATFEAGGSLNNTVSVTLSGGVVSSIDGAACSDCSLNVDFGFRVPGTNTLSGTVCLDEASNVGRCGTSSSGVESGESPLAGVSVALYQWVDGPGSYPGDAMNPANPASLDPGDTFVLLATTTTGANGDYAFTNVPNQVVVLLGVNQTQNLNLTTTAANQSVNSPAGSGLAGAAVDRFHEGLASYEGRTVTVSARESLVLSGNATNVDFAFVSVVLTDLGDLPDASTPGYTGPDYAATLRADDGPLHRTGGTWLGLGVTSETDGQITSALANADGGDDGVQLVSTTLRTGANGGGVWVCSTTGGWVSGWLDFNANGSLVDPLEQIVSRPISASADCPADLTLPANQAFWQRIDFEVPFDAISGTRYARFRVYPSPPAIEAPSGQALSSTFAAAEGEVEDYAWTFSVTQAVVVSFEGRPEAGGLLLEWETAAETGTIGFELQRWDAGRRRFLPVSELLPAVLEPQGGRYAFLDGAAGPGIPQGYLLVEVEANGTRNTHGPYLVDPTKPTRPEPGAGEVSSPRRSAGSDERRLDLGDRGYARRAHAIARSSVAGANSILVPPPQRGQQVTGVKIGVPTNGVYFVSGAELAALGFPTTRLRSKAPYALTNGDRRVALGMTPDGSGVFFYGQAIDSLYSRDNVYRFDAGGGTSPLMPVIRPAPAAAWGTETFERVEHFEEDRVPLVAVFDNPEADYWMWQSLFTGWAPRSFAFRTDAVVGGSEPPAIFVRLKGSSDTPADPDHHAIFRVNGESIGELRWDGLDLAETTLEIPAGLLVDGENTLEIEAVRGADVPYSVFYLDSFDVRYTSVYRARDNRLTAPAAGHPAIRVDGFSRPDVMVLELSDPARPVRVLAPVTPGPGGYSVTVPTSHPSAVYHVFTPDSALRPSWLEADLPSSLASPANAADYLVVTTAALAPGAQRLAQLRGELRPMVVDIADVYDEFGWSMPSPHALRAFLQHARRRWQTPPRYVVLAGDGSYDYRNLRGSGDNLIPPMMVWTPSGMFPSDNWLLGEDLGSSGSRTAIGRLPASTAAELEQMVDKIAVREATADEWLNREVFVADDADRAGDFAASSELLAWQTLPGGEVSRLYVDAVGATEVRRSLLQAIDEGVGSITYVGHGGYDVLAEEGLLGSGDLPAFRNDDRPTLLTAMTCLSAHFGVPGYPSLGESLVRLPTGGAAAVWGPTGLSENALATVLAKEYRTTLSLRAGTRLGDAITGATRRYRASGLPGYLPQIYVLLGDPAMRVR